MSNSLISMSLFFLTGHFCPVSFILLTFGKDGGMRGARLEVMRHLEPMVAEQLPVLLRDPETCWQPSDFSPDFSTETGREELTALQAEAGRLPDEAMAVLVGDMVTEEALPSYAAWIATLDGADAQGEPATAWGAWNRGWCGEENRHGDLMNRYLYLSGRVNMREVESTIQHLIHDGGDIEAENDPYRTFVYTSFQEIATYVSHLNLGKLAQSAGAARLHTLSKKIAGDESRHARAFKFFVSKFLEVDASEMVLAMEDMMRKKITMPAMYMRERSGERGGAFEKFEAVAQRIGVYTAHDYVDIMEQLLREWRVADLTGLTPAAEKAQAYLCRLPERYRKLMERFQPSEEAPMPTFRWLLPRDAATLV